MATPQTLHLDLYRRAGFIQPLTFTDEDGVVQDVSDWIIEAQVRLHPSADSDPTDMTVDKTDPTNGGVEVSLTGDQTAALPVGHLAWDLFVQVPGQQPQAVLAGAVRVRAETTRTV